MRRVCRALCERRFYRAAPRTDALQFNRAPAAHARKCMRRETATEPSTGSTPEFWKTERLRPVRLPTAHEQHGCSCPTRSSSPRSCARRDSHPCGRAGAIAEKHSAPASREIPQKQKLRQRRVHDFLNARICSLRCELVTAPRITQEISARVTATKLNAVRADGSLGAFKVKRGKRKEHRFSGRRLCPSLKRSSEMRRDD